MPRPIRFGPARFHRPRLECLETRRLLAVDLSFDQSVDDPAFVSVPSKSVEEFASSILGRSPEGESPNTVWTEDAESGLQFITPQVDADYSLIQSDVVSEGQHAFHLAHPNARSNGFEIDRNLSIGSQTKLFFTSQLSWATDLQVAKVQVSLDGGQNWPDTIFSQAGDGGAGDTGFGLKEVDLSMYSGQEIRIRFQYDLDLGSYFPQSTTGIGWHVDDIQIADQLEKSLYSIGNPSTDQQLYLELINRSRGDAIAEAERLAEDADSSLASTFAGFGIDPDDIVFQYTEQVRLGVFPRAAQPLSFHPALQSSAQFHTQDLFDNQFQGHVSSSNPPAPFQPGFTLSQRAAAFGYQGALGENVYSYSLSTEFGHAGFEVDWGAESPGAAGYNPAFAGQGMQNPSGHRITLHNGNFNIVGIGVINDSRGSVGPQLVTQNLGSSGSPSITGVVYEDLNENDFYDPGEGRPGIRIDVEGSAFYAISTASGGYTVPVSDDGVYPVTFSGGGFRTVNRTATITDGENQKIDYLVEPLANPPGPFDFGDASSIYPVTIDQDGARHQSGTILLGSMIDVESDGQTTNDASGDGDDDDGISLLASVIVDRDEVTTSSFFVRANEPGFVDAFIDFNRDGDWSDAGEKILDSVAVSSGPQVLSYSVPSSATPGPTMARFRISSAGGLSSIGVAEDGEVEDYQVELLDGTEDPSRLWLTDQTITFDSQFISVHDSTTENDSVVFSQAQQATGEVIVAARDSASALDVRLQGFEHKTSGLSIQGSDEFDTVRIETPVIDFRSDAFNVTGIERFDARGSTNTKVYLDPAILSESVDTPLQFQLGTGDQMVFPSTRTWQMESPVLSNGVVFHRAVDSNDTIIHVSLPSYWTNPIDRSDVDGNGQTTPVDALTIINKIRSGEFFDGETRNLVTPQTVSDFPGLFLDQNEDGQMTPVDALAVINEIRRRGSRSAEPENEIPSNGDQAIALSILPSSIPWGNLVARKLADRALDEFPLPANRTNDLWELSFQAGSEPRMSLDDIDIRSPMNPDAIDRLFAVEEINLRSPLNSDAISAERIGFRSTYTLAASS